MARAFAGQPEEGSFDNVDLFRARLVDIDSRPLGTGLEVHEEGARGVFSRSCSPKAAY
jgi:hypothetical protein